MIGTIINIIIDCLCIVLAYFIGIKRGKEITEDDVKFIIDKYSELPIQYGPKLFEEIAKQLKQHRP